MFEFVVKAGTWNHLIVNLTSASTILRYCYFRFFKSAMTEEAEEWGTHNKILSTRGKGLRRTIPKGFSYFNIEWGDGGFAQIIETQSFPKDFSLDTIAGMMDLDPMKFNRKKKAPDYDRDAVMKFLEGWKQFDWTNSLDADNA